MRTRRDDHSRFWTEIEELADALPELAHLQADIERAIANQIGGSLLGAPYSTALRAVRDRKGITGRGLVARTFWWGIHVEIASPDLTLGRCDPRTIAGSLRHLAIAAPVIAPFIGGMTGFITIHGDLLASVDTGKGVYLNMIWIIPNLFVPSPVR